LDLFITFVLTPSSAYHFGYLTGLKIIIKFSLPAKMQSAVIMLNTDAVNYAQCECVSKIQKN